MAIGKHRRVYVCGRHMAWPGYGAKAKALPLPAGAGRQHAVKGSHKKE